MFQGPALLTFAPQVIAQVELRPVIVRLEQCRPLQPGNGVLGPPVQIADQCPLEACTSRGLPRGRGVRRWVEITAEDRLASPHASPAGETSARACFQWALICD